MTSFTKPKGLNHVAYVTLDTAATKDFYTQVLGMRLVGHAEESAVGSTGEPTNFLHTFFEMGDGSCVAFFQIDGLETDHHESAIPRWAPHLALSVASREELDAAHARLHERGIEVVGPVEHEGIWSSIYFFDPNGVRLELTHQKRPLNDHDASTAEAAVDTWLADRSQPAGAAQ